MNQTGLCVFFIFSVDLCLVGIALLFALLDGSYRLLSVFLGVSGQNKVLTKSPTPVLSLSTKDELRVSLPRSGSCNQASHCRLTSAMPLLQITGTRSSWPEPIIRP